MHGVIPYYDGLHPKEVYENVIFHYTSPEAFMNIIEKKTLRFSRYDCLNDYKDGAIVKELFGPCLDELFYDGKIDKEYYEQYKLVDFMHSVFIKSADGSYFSVASKPYVCCFSMDGDSLQMWQYYSKNGKYEGYNIRFNLQEFNTRFGSLVRTGKIIYSDEKKRENIKSAIMTIYKTDCKNKAETGAASFSTRFLSSEMARFGCFCKEACFFGETEKRYRCHNC